MVNPVPALLSGKSVQAVCIAVLLLGYSAIPNVVDARCISHSVRILPLARSIVPVAQYCIDAGGTLQAPTKPEGGGPVCDADAGDVWPVLSGGGVNVWQVSNASSEMWSVEVYSNDSVEPSVVCTLQGCDTTEVPIVVPTISGYPSAVKIFVGIAALLVLPPIFAVFLARGLSVLGVRLYLRYGKPASFDHARFVKRVRTPIEFLFCTVAYFSGLTVFLAGLGC